MIQTAILEVPISVDTVSLQFPQRFGDAWNRHDVDAVMAHMTDDCTFVSSVGADLVAGGCQGRVSVTAAVRAFIETWPDGHFGSLGEFIAANRGVSEWIFSGTKADGTKLRTRGCDVLTFENGKIKVKDAYRKQLP